MKQTTLTIINDSQNKAINAFRLAAQSLNLAINIVSVSDSPIMDISVKYNEDAELFLLGQSFSLYNKK